MTNNGKIKIELEKNELISGKIIYYIVINGICEEAILDDEHRAFLEFDKYIERAKAGYPKSEIIKTKIIQ